MSGESFPRQEARTRRFTLGAPRGFRVASDGSRVAFVRSRAGDDAVGGLWVLDVDAGEERLVLDPSDPAADEQLTPEERDRRERMREALLSEIELALANPGTPALRALEALTADAAEPSNGR